MLREHAKKLEELNFPRRRHVNLPGDMFKPEFMKALAQESEMNGIVNDALQLASDKTSEYIGTYHNDVLGALDEAHETGVQLGYKRGLTDMFTPAKNKGIQEGILTGWRDAATFKDPIRVYDVSKPSTEPFVKAATMEDLAVKIPDTKENRLWRAFTNDTSNQARRDLHHWEKVKGTPFTIFEEGNRLGLDLNKFVKEKDTDIVRGYEGFIDASGKANKREKPMSMQGVLDMAMGVNTKLPTEIPAIPPRPSTKLEESLLRGKYMSKFPALENLLHRAAEEVIEPVNMPTDEEIRDVLGIAEADEKPKETEKPTEADEPGMPAELDPATQVALGKLFDMHNEKPKETEVIHELPVLKPKSRSSSPEISFDETPPPTPEKPPKKVLSEPEDNIASESSSKSSSRSSSEKPKKRKKSPPKRKPQGKISDIFDVSKIPKPIQLNIPEDTESD